jgi:hypothetical protein
MAAISDTHHISPECDLRQVARPFLVFSHLNHKLWVAGGPLINPEESL